MSTLSSLARSSSGDKRRLSKMRSLSSSLRSSGDPLNHENRNERSAKLIETEKTEVGRVWVSSKFSRKSVLGVHAAIFSLFVLKIRPCTLFWRRVFFLKADFSGPRKSCNTFFRLSICTSNHCQPEKDARCYAIKGMSQVKPSADCFLWVMSWQRSTLEKDFIFRIRFQVHVCAVGWRPYLFQ